MAEVIAQRQLRNDISRVLARVRAGEEFVVTVNGEEVAELRPRQRTGSTAAFLAAMARCPRPSTEVLAELVALDAEIEAMDSDGAEDWS